MEAEEETITFLTVFAKEFQFIGCTNATAAPAWA